ncbi:MAG: hypothetical protein L0Y54_12540 [Sporichthyaceae bacterium]|nr:hypothetical protein [Sporichthyaceae bacterium]
MACTAGSVPWRPLTDLGYDDFAAGVTGKVLSQVELVRQGTTHLPETGSFTLITGIAAREAVLTGSVAALANGAIESFVRAAAIELPSTADCSASRAESTSSAARSHHSPIPVGPGGSGPASAAAWASADQDCPETVTAGLAAEPPRRAPRLRHWPR